MHLSLARNHAERESIVGNRSSEFFHRTPSSGTTCKSDKIYPARCTPSMYPRATQSSLVHQPLLDHPLSIRSTMLYEIYNRNSFTSAPLLPSFVNGTLVFLVLSMDSLINNPITTPFSKENRDKRILAIYRME